MCSRHPGRLGLGSDTQGQHRQISWLAQRPLPAAQCRVAPTTILAMQISPGLLPVSGRNLCNTDDLQDELLKRNSCTTAAVYRLHRAGSLSQKVELRPTATFTGQNIQEQEMASTSVRRHTSVSRVYALSC